MLGKKIGPVAERKQFIEDWLAGGCRDLAGLSRTYGISRKTGHKRVQRLLAGGYPSRLGVKWSGSGSHTRHRSVGAARSPKPSGLALRAREAIVPGQPAQIVAASLLGRELRFKLIYVRG